MHKFSFTTLGINFKWAKIYILSSYFLFGYMSSFELFRKSIYAHIASILLFLFFNCLTFFLAILLIFSYLISSAIFFSHFGPSTVFFPCYLYDDNSDLIPIFLWWGVWDLCQSLFSASSSSNTYAMYKNDMRVGVKQFGQIKWRKNVFPFFLSNWLHSQQRYVEFYTNSIKKISSFI